jgi:hypothetical protein
VVQTVLALSQPQQLQVKAIKVEQVFALQQTTLTHTSRAVAVELAVLVLMVLT